MVPYWKRFLKCLWENSVPWARDNIFWAGMTVVIPPIVVWLHNPKHLIDWAVVYVTLCLYVACFAIYFVIHGIRAVLKLDKQQIHDMERLRTRLETQVSVSPIQENDPRIVVEFSDERKYQARTASLTVINRGTRNARMVRIRPVKLNTRTIEFPGFVDLIGPNESKRFAPEVGNQWGYDSHSDLVRAMSENWVKGTDYKNVRECSVIVKVDYEDDDEVQFEAIFELLYHGGFAYYNPANMTIMECKNFRYRRIPSGVTPPE